MTFKQILSKDYYLDFLSKIIEGRYCKECKTFSMSNCVQCRKCGAQL